MQQRFLALSDYLSLSDRFSCLLSIHTIFLIHYLSTFVGSSRQFLNLRVTQQLPSRKLSFNAFTSILSSFRSGCHFVKVVQCFVFSWHRSAPCFSMADDESQWPAMLYGWKPYVEAPSAYKLFFLLYLHVWLLSRWNLFFISFFHVPKLSISARAHRSV